MRMGRKRHTILTLTVMVVLVAGVSASSPALAQGLISLFDVGVGARPLGMGGAFTALADDENALFYNPAGLASQEKFRFGSFWEPRFGGSFGDLALAGEGLGAGLIFYNLGGIPRYDAQGRPQGSFTYGATGTVGAGGLRVGKLLGVLPEGLAVGLAAKLYQISVPDNPGGGMAFDLGLLWAQEGLRLGTLPLRLQLGAVVRNLLGFGVRYKNGHVDPWQLNLRLGSALSLKALTLAVDFESRRGRGFHLGSEYRLKLERVGLSGLALRLGGFFQGGLVFTLGLGLNYKSFWVDYALIAYPRAPSTHRLSFAVKFSLPAF